MRTSPSYMKGLFRNCNMFINKVKNNNIFYDIKIEDRYNVEICLY